MLLENNEINEPIIAGSGNIYNTQFMTTNILHHCTHKYDV